ncbi:MAG TPA: toll/interleukin-1 receptor domain-containing protein [Myxococcales bacterium]
MKLLGRHAVHHGNEEKWLELYEGDLAAIPPADAVDILVVSAFPDNYVATPTSVIGALYKRGISVADLADDKEEDLRDSLHCWLSRDIRSRHPDAGFSRILCFEAPLDRDPAEIVGDVFRAIMPFALTNVDTRSVAMPLLASGDQGHDPNEMLAAIFRAATHWFARGMPVDVIKIVVRRVLAAYTQQAFEGLCLERRGRVVPGSETAVPTAGAMPAVTPPQNPAPIKGRAGRARSGEKPAAVGAGSFEPAAPSAPASYDCFISYSREDEKEVDALVQQLKNAHPELRVFQDKLEIQLGDSWQSELDEVLETCRKVIAIYSPTYLTSRMCMEEFNMARLRHRENESGVLLPVYLRSTKLPLYMRSLQYFDCREADPKRIAGCCERLATSIAS